MESPLKAFESASRLQIAFFWAGLGAVGAALLLFHAIFTSASSTAAIGIIFIPFLVVPVAAVFFVFGYCVSDLFGLATGKATHRTFMSFSRAAVAAILFAVAVSYIVYGTALTVAVQRARTADQQKVTELLDHSAFKNNKLFLGGIAENPAASAEDLDRIARMPDPELSDRMGTLWPVMQGNRRGLAVMRLVAMNNNVSQPTLVYLARSSNEYVLGAVGANPKTPVSILSDLARRNSYLINLNLALNPSSPVEVLRGLVNDSDEHVRYYARTQLQGRGVSVP